jgi:hypothetical protein
MRPLPELLKIPSILKDELQFDGGAWKVTTPPGRSLLVIASWGLGWDHVSVSGKTKVPSWHDMEFVKRLFFRDYETAVQFHVPPSEHINCHPYCLHMWRPNDGRIIPRPPDFMVA